MELFGDSIDRLGPRGGPRPPPIRALFACLGWPCGILDLASWIQRLNLAQVRVVQIQPGRLFSLPRETAALLAPGPIDPQLAEAFAQRGRRIGRGAVLHQPIAKISTFTNGTESWLLDDADYALQYRLTIAPNEYEGVLVEQPDQLDARGLDGAASADELLEALQSVGRDFLCVLRHFRPHVVGFRVEAGDFERIRLWTAIVHRHCEAAVILGGPTATSHPRELLEDSGADFVFTGDAEQPLVELLRAALMPRGRDMLPTIDGLAYRFGGNVYVNSLPADGYERTAIDLDDDRGSPSNAGFRLCGSLPGQPWPQPDCGRSLGRRANRPEVSEEIIRANILDWNLLEHFRSPFDSLYFTGGRGCPGRCAFCARLHGTLVRTKTAEQLLEEIASADRLVAEGRLRVSQWDLFAHTQNPPTASRDLRWAALYDEDFFLDRNRSLEFFDLWERSPLKNRYRLSLQTNPCSLLRCGRPDTELFAWIDRLKPMIQLGAESFHDEVLQRWRKRHSAKQCEQVLDALDATETDYTCFVLLTDFDSTPAEVIESLRRLALSALRHPRMRVASNPFTIPLFDSEIRRRLEYAGRLTGRVRHFTDYEQVQPGWMDPLTARLADVADAELQWCLELEHRNEGLRAALVAVTELLDDERLRQSAVEALCQVDQALRERAFAHLVDPRKQPPSNQRR